MDGNMDGPDVAGAQHGAPSQEPRALPGDAVSSNAGVAMPPGPPPSSLTPETARILELERSRITRLEQQNAGRYQRAWHHERHLRLLRERQVRRLLQRYAPSGPPEAIQQIEEKIARSEQDFAARPREAAAPHWPYPLGRDGQYNQAPYLLAPGGRRIKGEGERDALAGDDSVTVSVQELHTRLIQLLQTEVAALGYDPQDPLFEEWLASDVFETVRIALRALGSLAQREAERLAGEVRRRTMEEEQSWNAIKPMRQVDPDEEDRITRRLHRSLGF